MGIKGTLSWHDHDLQSREIHKQDFRVWTPLLVHGNSSTCYNFFICIFKVHSHLVLLIQTQTQLTEGRPCVEAFKQIHPAAIDFDCIWMFLLVFLSIQASGSLKLCFLFFSPSLLPFPYYFFTTPSRLLCFLLLHFLQLNKVLNLNKEFNPIKGHS